jgi:hypothetical protein
MSRPNQTESDFAHDMEEYSLFMKAPPEEEAAKDLFGATTLKREFEQLLLEQQKHNDPVLKKKRREEYLDSLDADELPWYSQDLQDLRFRQLDKLTAD